MPKRKLETLETSEGNTSPPKKRIVPSKRWCFTKNNYEKDEVETLETLFKLHDIEYIFGEEIGDGTTDVPLGTPHLQGYIECPTKIRPIEKLGLKTFHWEKTKGTRGSNLIYCSKDGKYVHSPLLKPRRPLVLIKPRGWQLDVLKIIENDPDDRTLHWFYEHNGGVGKTAMCKYLIKKHNAIVLGGKAADIKNGIVTYYEKWGYTPELIVVNYCRSMEEFVSYEGLESMKDMMFYSGKYEGGQVCDACPHVIVFANFEPQT
ncbi:replication protein, partial [uncultured marine virus]